MAIHKYHPDMQKINQWQTVEAPEGALFFSAGVQFLAAKGEF